MHLRSMILKAQVMTILIMPGGMNADSNPDESGLELIERKAQLGYQMLGQLATPNADRLRIELTTLVSSINRNQLESHLLRIDKLLAQIADLYRQRHDRRDLLNQQVKDRFLRGRAELASLDENLDKAATDSTELATQRHEYRKALEDATTQAAAGNYSLAVKALDRARQALVQVITLVNTSHTIEYKLDFADITEEYDYELRRYASQKLLLQLAIQERTPTPGEREKINQVLAIAEALNEEAQGHAQSAHYDEALYNQELAVGKLNSLLRLMGYFF